MTCTRGRGVQRGKLGLKSGRSVTPGHTVSVGVPSTLCLCVERERERESVSQCVCERERELSSTAPEYSKQLVNL